MEIHRLLLWISSPWYRVIKHTPHLPPSRSTNKVPSILVCFLCNLEPLNFKASPLRNSNSFRVRWRLPCLIREWNEDMTIPARGSY